jgi:hypothetical protein
MRASPTDQAILERQGCVEVDYPPDSGLLQLAAAFGIRAPAHRGGPLVDRLSPKRAEDAPTRSLSAAHGLGGFPMHTDAAHFRIPPRYVLLRLAMDGRSNRPTLIQNIRDLHMDERSMAILRRDVWLVNGGRGRFLTSLLSDTLVPRHLLVRFDRACMRPVHPSFLQSESLLETALATTAPLRVDWVHGKALVIDNWQALHARSGSPRRSNEDRILERVLIMGHGT